MNTTLEAIEVDVSHIITEDDTPVDNIFSEHQQRLLTESLNAHWRSPDGLPFLVAANIGVFYGMNLPPIVPDVFVSFGVSVSENVWEKRHRSYFVWEYSKPPEIVIKIVSNLDGGELGEKLSKYALAGASYYVVYDPAEHYGTPTLRVSGLLRGKKYEQLATPNDTIIFDEYGIGVTLQHGDYGAIADKVWLRWCLPKATLFPQARKRKKNWNTSNHAPIVLKPAPNTLPHKFLRSASILNKRIRNKGKRQNNAPITK